MEDLFNVEIIVLDFKIGPTKYPEKYDKCMMLQIELEGKKRVTWSSSKNLEEQIQKIGRENLPIRATIVRLPDKRHMFK